MLVQSARTQRAPTSARSGNVLASAVRSFWQPRHLVDCGGHAIQIAHQPRGAVCCNVSNGRGRLTDIGAAMGRKLPPSLEALLDDRPPVAGRPGPAPLGKATRPYPRSPLRHLNFCPRNGVTRPIPISDGSRAAHGFGGRVYWQSQQEVVSNSEAQRVEEVRVAQGDDVPGVLAQHLAWQSQARR